METTKMQSEDVGTQFAEKNHFPEVCILWRVAKGDFPY